SARCYRSRCQSWRVPLRRFAQMTQFTQETHCQRCRAAIVSAYLCAHGFLVKSAQKFSAFRARSKKPRLTGAFSHLRSESIAAVDQSPARSPGGRDQLTDVAAAIAVRDRRTNIEARAPAVVIAAVPGGSRCRRQRRA